MELSDPLEPHSSTASELKALIEMERAGQPFIAWRDEACTLQLRPLSPHGLAIGRTTQCAISLGWDRAVSSVHAEVRPLAGEWVIVDDGLSRNGTFVGGERIVGRRRLRDGDRISVGKTVL